jgi:hypothetical protein
MRRFGFSLLIIFVFFIIAAPSSCTKSYDEKEMDYLFTFDTVVMNIVNSEYIGKQIPEKITKDQIEEIVIRRNGKMDELKYLDRYNMVIVSNGTQIGCVIWDPENERKLIQDLRCTPYPDERTWRKKVFGHDFTLSWSICNATQ